MKPIQYPFSAIVEQDSMKTALILNAINPSIGGVLIRGHKGTGKSTAARALAQLLPQIEVVDNCPFNSDPQAPVDWGDIEIEGRHKDKPKRKRLRPMPFIELPLNATEDRLVGSLHVEKALQTGKRSLEPGLLAAANRGILYVDEVNLLEDHLVDMLLDAAASGINVIEREGVSVIHPARFILIGTMNPEEGELRPQFLDRFGLCTVVHSISDLKSREAIVRRRLAFESDPERFLREWERSEAMISNQIVRAREQLGNVAIPENLMSFTVRLAQSLQVQGHRAEITILKAARAHAAFLEKGQVENEDVAEAARLAVPHRMRSSPLDSIEDLHQRIDHALADPGSAGLIQTQSENPDPLQTPDDIAEQIQVPGSMAAGSILFSFLASKEKTEVFEADPRIASAAVEVEQLLEDSPRAQRKSKTRTISRSGRYRRAVRVRAGERGYKVALDATLRQAAIRHARERTLPVKGMALQREDLCKKQYLRPCEHLIVFVVDASDSMGSGAEVRMKAAKGAVLAILRKAYQSRSEVAMVAFGGEQARVALPATSSIETAKRLLERLPTGGATPFADGLSKAWQVIRSSRLKNSGVRPVMVIISDGEANVPLCEGVSPLEELGALAEKIGQDRIEAIFIDAAAPSRRRGEMQSIAHRMRASYVTMHDLTAPRLLKAVRSVDLDSGA
jgi:magnesium chelatase subunit D